MHYFTDPLQSYFVTEGRATRKAYWLFVLCTTLISFALGIIDGLFFPDSETGVFSALFSLFVLVPSITFGVRRMHDAGFSGWWIICPLVNIVITLMPGEVRANEYGAVPRDL